MKYGTLFVLLLTVLPSIALAQSWTSLNSPAGFKNVRDMTTNSTGDTMYAADEVNLLKSTNNGQTWSATSSAVAAPLATLCKWDNSSIVLVSGSNFFKRSTNGGTSWSDLLTGVTNKPTAFANFPLSAAQMLLGRKYASTSVKAIARSTDGGVTWTDELSSSYKPRIFDIATNLTTVDATLTNFAVAAGGPDGTVANERGLFYTENYGATWTARETAASDPSWTAVAFAYDNIAPGLINEVWAGTADGKLYKGVWKATTMTHQTAFPPGHTYPDTVRAIRIDPNNYSIIYVATDRSVYKTTNAGSSWASAYASGMTDSRCFAIEINPANSSKVVVGTRGYIYRTTDAASTWSSITSGATRTLPLISVTKSGDTVYAVSNELTVGMKYTASTWSTVRIGHKDSTFFGKHSIAIPNGSGVTHIFHSGVQDNTSAVYLSKDKGATFGMQQAFFTTTAGTTAEGITRDPGNLARAYAFGNLRDGATQESHFYSTNYGDTWQKDMGSISSSTVFSFAALGDANPSSYLFAGIQSGGLQRTTNLGSTWNAASGILGSASVNASVSNPKVLSVAYAGGVGGLWRSDNANSTGIFSDPDGSLGDVKRILIDPRFTDVSHNSAHLYWVGINNLIYHSENSGTSSNTSNGNLPSGIVINDLRSDPADTTVLYIATDRGIYTAQLPKTPSLTSPSNNATNILYCIASTENMVFTWSAVSGATSYDFQMDTTTNFNSPLLVAQSPSTNLYSHSADLTRCNTPYYWRVRSSDGTNFGKSPYSAPFKFTTSACSPAPLSPPTVSYPIDSVTNIPTNPTFSWSAVSGAIKYKLVIVGFTTKYATGTSLQVSGLAHNTWYRWNVTGVSCNALDTVSATEWFKTCLNCQSGPQGPETVHRGVQGENEITEYSLLQNYPNPFNPATRFDYALLEDGYVRLSIYNTLGQVVATLVDEAQSRGWKSVEFDARHLPSGVYFYRLDAGVFHSIKKMILMK